MTAANDLAVCRALERAGVEFIDENGGGPGSRRQQRGRDFVSCGRRQRGQRVQFRALVRCGRCRQPTTVAASVDND